MLAVRELMTFFGISFSALLPLINPVGDALVFLELVGPAPAEVYRELAKKIAISTTLFLLVIQAIGTAMLKFFGISLPVMQVSGGFVIAGLGWNLLNQQESPTTSGPRLENADLASLHNKVFYPFTFPITAGPGCIAVMVTLSAHASAKAVATSAIAHAGILIAVVSLSLAVYVCYGYAPALTARVRPHTVQGILRVMAFVLLCIGVQIMWNGAEALLETLRH